MNFVVLPAERTMSIDNAAIEVSTTHLLPRPDIEILAWNGASGKGFIEYNHGPRIVERFEDIIPYRFFVDAWLGAAPGLSLSQAMQIKIDMVDTLYNYKRRAPYPHSDGQSYEASDEAVMYMAAAVAASGLYDRLDELIGRIDAEFTSMITQLRTGVTNYNQGAAAIDQWSVGHANNWASLDLSYNPDGGVPGDVNSDVFQSGTIVATRHFHTAILARASRDFINRNTGIGAGGFLPMQQFTAPDVSGGVQSTIWWQTLSSGAPYGINAITFRDALRGILARRNVLEQERRQNKAVIQGQGSIAAVIARDVALGWSY